MIRDASRESIFVAVCCSRGFALGGFVGERGPCSRPQPCCCVMVDASAGEMRHSCTRPRGTRRGGKWCKAVMSSCAKQAAGPIGAICVQRAQAGTGTSVTALDSVPLCMASSRLLITDHDAGSGRGSVRSAAWKRGSRWACIIMAYVREQTAPRFSGSRAGTAERQDCAMFRSRYGRGVGQCEECAGLVRFGGRTSNKLWRFSWGVARSLGRRMD